MYCVVLCCPIGLGGDTQYISIPIYTVLMVGRAIFVLTAAYVQCVIFVVFVQKCTPTQLYIRN
jgi:hypothetical protein